MVEEFENRWVKEDEIDIEDKIEINTKSDGIVNTYSDKFPREIKRAIAGIDGNVQYAIIAILVEEGEMPFSELKQKLDLHQQTLSDRLNELQKGSLINRKEYGDIKDKYSVYYKVSEYGETFVECLFNSLELGQTQTPDPEVFVEDPDIKGASFTTFESVNRSSTGGRRVTMTEPTNNITVNS